MPPPRLHDDEVEIDIALAQRLVAEQLPRYASLPVRRVASGGTENAVFRLGDDLALRLPLTPGAVGGLLKEIRWLPVVGPHLTLDVPEVVATGAPAADYPFPWAVVRWLPGNDALAEEFTSLADTARRLGEVVLELQAIPDVPPPGSQEDFGRGGPLVGRDPAFREFIVRCDGLLDVERVTSIWDDALAAPAWTGPSVWLHADLLPGNLLVRDGVLAGVLDFGAMATGDPAYDITAAWHVLDGPSRRTFREIVQPDDATWLRAQGLVVSGAAIALPYYQHTNPSMVETARRGLAAVVSDQR
ncbi:aminoglycoside phosphotransferase family protein [Angustibacter luteus]|uniref:Aminoglycoside phosphotransferase family protein n=1 Tax=Angustibacter luteus TaxID=658456 RepID=A0ABW1JFA3_9ACTN